jgi:multicomponent Na+:H+ antiporter subunit D
MNVSQLPIIILLVPLFAALFVCLSGLTRKHIVYPLAIGANVIFCGLVGTAFFKKVDLHYAVANWKAPLGIELVLDPLAAFVLTVIGTISLLVFIYARSALRHELPQREPSFFGLALIMQFGLSGMVMTGDLFNLYVFLEIASLAAYALLAVGRSGAAFSAFRYLLLGSVGASFYLLGLGFLYVSTGSLNMSDITVLFNDGLFSPVHLIAFVLMVAGIAFKMALFPMHAWLPDAYTNASSSATALIAPLMTKVSAYALIRIIFFLYQPLRDPYFSSGLELIAWLSCGGILLGSIMAMMQTDLKRILAYSSISQISYIGLGIGMASPLALVGALLHVLNHALMKSSLFMAAGNIEQNHRTTHLLKLNGLAKEMPWTCACLTAAALAMVGLPPTVGFFSKWYLASAALNGGQWFFVLIILISSLLTAVYMFRIIESLYLKKSDRAKNVSNEIPWLMRVPLGVTAVGTIAVGFMSPALLEHLYTFIQKVF